MSGLIMKWLADVFSHPDLLGALVIAGKTAIIYLFLVGGLRLLGKRELGQMSVYDLVLIVVIANSVQNAMLGKDTTLIGGLVAAFTLMVLNRIFNWLLTDKPAVRRALIGDPVLIVCDGQYLQGPMHKEGVTRQEVMAAMRKHGVAELHKVRMAVLEVDGEITIVPMQEEAEGTHHRIRGIRAD
jgi:uncharacterized membrane protein YcaP (DUF421 family)